MAQLIRTLSIGALAAFIATGIGMAEAPSKNDLQSRQAVGLSRISGVEGSWAGTNLRWDEKAGRWAAPASTPQISTIRISAMEHGRAYRLHLKSPAYEVDGYLTYDVWNDRYVLASIDDFIGQIDLQQGRFSGEQLILDNLKADTVYAPQGKATNTRVAFRFDHGRLKEIQIDSSDNGGAQWRPTQLVQIKPAQR